MTEDRGIDLSETIVENAQADEGSQPILLAQADTGSDPASSSSSGGATPVIGVIVPDGDNKVTLAATASIEDIKLDGNDLLLIQPDGSQIRIIGGALSVPTFIIGDIELPQDVLVAALDSNGFNVAAGPGNTLSVTPQAPASSGGDFEDSNGSSIGGEGFQSLGLLGDTSGDDTSGGAGTLNEDTGNIAAVLTGGDDTGETMESVDNPGGVDADPVAATGSITFFDPDFGETRTAEVMARAVVSQSLNNGAAPLTAAQLDTLLAGFSLDSAGGITTESTTAAGGTIDWTYFVGNGAVDFLAAGEVITLSFGVRINDGIFSVTQTVTVTVTGTNDVPVITSGVQGGTIEETADELFFDDADPADVAGTITFTDVDLSDQPTAAVTSRDVTTAKLANGSTLTPDQITALLDAFSLDAANGVQNSSFGDGAGEVAWTYDATNAAIDFLGKTDQLVLTFTVTVDDGHGGTAAQDVTITVTGTNDAPLSLSPDIEINVVEAVDLGGAAGKGELSGTLEGAFPFSDVDVSDVQSFRVVGAFYSSGELGGATVADFNAAALGLMTVTGSQSSLPTTTGGELRWQLDSSDDFFDYLGKGESVTINYYVEVADGNDGLMQQVVAVTVTGANDGPVITSPAQAGSVDETADVVAGVDPDPAAATGTISFLDVDLSDDPQASHDGGTVSNMAFAHGYTPTDEQIAALKAGFSLDDAALSNFSNGTGSTGWTYQVANAAVDFLGAGDSVELTYVVTIDDGNLGTVTQNVVITVTGTSDAPTVSAAENFVVSEEDLTNGNSGALIFTGDVGLNFNDYSSTGLSVRLKTSGAIPLDLSGGAILLNSDGVLLGYSLLTRGDGTQKLVGFKPTNGEIIFSLDFDIVADGSGGYKVVYTFELRGNLDHVGSGVGDSMPLDFTVTAKNSAGETASNTFTVTINDDIPDAADVTATMGENTTTVISLVEGDGADVEAGEAYVNGADDATVTLGTPTYSNLPAGVVPGTPGISLTPTANGYDVSITPGTAFDALAEGETLLMEIPFTVEDSDGDIFTKAIVVTVTGTNDVPVISAVTDVSEILTETDAALSTTGSFDVADVDTSDIVTITGVTVATSGTGVNAATPDTAALLAMFGPNSGVVIDDLSSTATVNWTFDTGSEAFDYLKAGESLGLTYTVNIADGNGGTVAQAVTITITGTNDAPVISPIVQPAVIAEAVDASVQDIAPVAGTLSVTDAEAGDTLTAQAGVPVISWSGGILSAAQQTALTAALASGALTLGSAVSNGGTVGIGYTWDPAAADLDFLAAGQTLTVTYDVAVSDGAATSGSQPLVFTIAGTNDLPVAVNDNPNGSLPEFKISEDQTVAKVFDVLSNDTLDPDAGAANSVSLGTIRGYGVPGVAQGQILDAVSSGFFTITVDSNNQIQVQLNTAAWQSFRRGETAKIDIDYKLHGDGSDVATGSLQVAVTGSNDAPVLDASASPMMTQLEDAALPSGDVGTLVSTLVNAVGGSVGNVNDVDGKTFAPGMSITAFDTSHGVWYYHWDGENAPDGSPYWFNANLAPGQVLNLRAQDQLYFKPAADYAGTVDGAITFRAWDGVASPGGKVTAPGSVGGETAYSTGTDTVSLTVENVNDAPVLVSNLADKTVFSGIDFDIDVASSFTDIDPGDVFSYSATLANGDPLPVWLSIDPATGRLSGVAPAVSVAGETLEVSVTATDSGGLPVSDTFELAIDNAVDAPVITAHTDGGVTEDASFAGGGNVITNGGFETGNTSGWVVTNPANIFVSSYLPNVHSGGSAVGGWSVYGHDIPVTYSQSFDTVAGETYTISFWAQNKGSHLPADNSILVTWNGATVGSVVDIAFAGSASNYTEFSYTFTATSSSSTLAFAVVNNVNYTYLDDISVVRPAGTETTGGTISFTDADVGETHTASFAPSAGGFLGTFSAVVSTESSGGTPGTVDWTFEVADADIQHLAGGETVTQTYTVTIEDGNGGTVSQDIDVVLTGVNDAPVVTGLADSAVEENDAGVVVDSFDVSDVDTATGLTFRILDSLNAVDDRFEVVPAGATNDGQPGTYELRLKSGVSLDHGSDPTIDLHVEVNDHGSVNNLTMVPVTVTVNVADDYAADNTTTGVVSVGGSVSAAIDFSEDQDWFAVTLEAGRTYRIDLQGQDSGSGTLVDTYLRGLFTSNGVYIPDTVNDDVDLYTFESRLSFTAGESGTYYISAGAYGHYTGSYTLGVTEVTPLVFAGEAASGTNMSALSSAELSPIIAAALLRWEAAGLSDEQLLLLSQTDVSIADLGGATLGLTANGGIVIDINAAGHGWYVDQTPEDDVEFESGSAPDGVDLLTVVMHEFGHVLELGHSDGAAHGLMASELAAGERRLPDMDDVSGHPAAQTIPGDAGDNLLVGGDGDDLLSGLDGDDILDGGLGADTLTGGAGADTFVFDSAALADAGGGIKDLIADYNFAEGDVVDLSALLGTETVAGNEAEYVRMSGALLEVDVDGTGGPAGFVQIAEFAAVPAAGALKILVDDDPADVTVVI